MLITRSGRGQKGGRECFEHGRRMQLDRRRFICNNFALGAYCCRNRATIPGASQRWLREGSGWLHPRILSRPSRHGVEIWGRDLRVDIEQCIESLEYELSDRSNAEAPGDQLGKNAKKRASKV